MKKFCLFLLLLIATPCFAQHSVKLSWLASPTSGTQYNVYRGATSGGPYTKINAAPLSVLTYTDATVQGNGTYYYVATAYCSAPCGTAAAGESVFSNEVKTVIPGDKVLPPSGLNADTVALLTWPAVPNVDGYNVYSSTNGHGCDVSSKPPAGTTCTKLNTNLVLATSYYVRPTPGEKTFYWIRSFGNGVESYNSPAKSVKL